MCDIKLGSLNINGAREEVKRAALFSLFIGRKLDVVVLQETHSTAENEPAWRRGGMEKSSSAIRAAAVDELLCCFLGFLPSSCVTENIIEGRLLKIQAVFENVKMTFINVYAPTVGTERAFIRHFKHCCQHLQWGR